MDLVILVDVFLLRAVHFALLLVAVAIVHIAIIVGLKNLIRSVKALLLLVIARVVEGSAHVAIVAQRLIHQRLI